MNSNEIIQLLRNNKACNFIGIAITPLHSNGIDAVLRYLGNRGEKIEAEIPRRNLKFCSNWVYICRFYFARCRQGLGFDLLFPFRFLPIPKY